MEIRKFVISIVSRFDAKGFRAAEQAAKRLRQVSASSAKQIDQVSAAHGRSGRAAERAALTEKRAAARAAAARERAAERAAAAEKRAAIKSARARARAWQKMLRDDARAHKKRLRMAARAAAAEHRASAKRTAEIRSSLASVGDMGAAIGRAVGVAALGLAGMSAGVIHVGTSFESLRARLKTVEGSAAGAEKAFAQIQEFTKTTPFQLEEVTTAFVRLKSLGLDASKESMSAFGNLAAAQGKSIIDFIEAVADASTGEFERLKEFGIKASSQGEKVAFTFKGQTTTVGKNAKEIQEFLKNLGETEFAGAMGDQMATAAGLISNLKDQFMTFLDQVAQLGVLEEFKLLLKDIMGISDDGSNFAKILANAIIRAIRGIRAAISGIRQEDMESLLRGLIEVAKTFVTVLDSVATALRFVTDISGGADKAIVNMTLAVIALTAAFKGPAGLVVTAGAVGAMIGNLLNEFFNASDAVEGLLERITGLKKELADLDREAKRGKRGAPELEGGPITQERTFDLAEAAADAARVRAREMGIENVEYFANLERERVQKAVGMQGQVLATTAGARDIALGLGVASDLDQQSRESLQRAAEFALGLGEVETAARARAEAAGGGRRTGKGTGKASRFFEFEKKARQAAKQQGETFAEQELQRLIAEGVASQQAIAMAREAGKQRAKDLEQRFLDAGRIFEADTNNILDILGLRGPGSVLEGRPPPQTLIISINPVFKLIENFNQTIGKVDSAETLAEVTGQGGQAAVENGLMANQKQIREFFTQMLNLQVDALQKAAGGGSLPRGAQG